MEHTQADLLVHLDKLHTTALGVGRVRKNLDLGPVDVVDWCRRAICQPDCTITRRGKNWYASTAAWQITINAASYTIITAHKSKTRPQSIP